MWYLPGFEPPGFSKQAVLQSLKQASEEVRRRLHNRKDSVRHPKKDDPNQSYWVWISDCVPACEGLDHLKKISEATAVARHRRKFLAVLRDLAIDGCVEVEESGTKPRFRLSQL
jgi:hypothetical protein